MTYTFEQTAYDLCMAWTWEHDAAFVGLLEEECALIGRSLLQVTTARLPGVVGALHERQLKFRIFIDRASDEQPAFVELADWAREHRVQRINRREMAIAACDKVAMHLAVCRAAINTPPTLILAPYSRQPELRNIDLEPFQPEFVVKPARRGGGEGVVRGSTVDDIAAARQTYPVDSYLVQAMAKPVNLDGRPAWFRIIYCLGHTFPCWWDCLTHRYELVSSTDVDRHGLVPLTSIVQRIAWICGLDLFSSEVALVAAGVFCVVDYVNDPLDLRLQSHTQEGVPDEIARSVAHLLASTI